MEAVVDQMVTRGAELLGLAIDHPAVTQARMTAREAVRCGYDADTAYEYARRVMIQAATPEDAAEAA